MAQKMTQLRLASLYKYGMTGGNPEAREKTAKGPSLSYGPKLRHIKGLRGRPVKCPNASQLRLE